MYERLTEAQYLTENWAFIEAHKSNTYMAFRSLLLALGKKTFDFLWEDTEGDFETRIEQFHKAMRQMNFFGVVNPDKSNAYLDMALWYLCASSPVPFQIMHKIYLEENHTKTTL